MCPIEEAASSEAQWHSTDLDSQRIGHCEIDHCRTILVGEGDAR